MNLVIDNAVLDRIASEREAGKFAKWHNVAIRIIHDSNRYAEGVRRVRKDFRNGTLSRA